MNHTPTRLHSLRAEAKRSHPEGKDSLPPIYSIDLVGFGHSEKPDLSYTQYVWESQIVDFVAEVMGGRIGAVRHRDGATFYVELQASTQTSLL